MAKTLELFSKNYTEIQKVAAGALSAGDLVTLQETNGFTLIDVAIGDQYALITKAEKVKVEKTAPAILAGDAVYYVNATDNVAIAGDILIGYAYEDAAIDDTHIVIVFDGMAAFEKL